jgi:TatD DNase family protein
MLIDSHCHLDRLDLTPYQGDLGLALKAAYAQDVKHFLCVCIDLDHFPQLINITENHTNVRTTLGLHPTESIEKEPNVEELVALAKHPKVIGIGETGLDYYRCEGDMEWQRQRFRNHIHAAKALKKPLIVHSRMAQIDTIRILKDEKADNVGGIIHCFTESLEMAKAALDLGFYISFSGIITFSNAKDLREVAKQVPLKSTLIETDSPYLAPVPYRGKSNEPAYVRYVAEALAHIKETDLETIAMHTTTNFFRLFTAATT